MPPRKRSRDISDVDGDVEVEVESASSSLRHTGFPKRSRVALAQENGGSVVSDDDDEEASGDMERYEESLQMMGSDSGGEDDEIEDFVATQIVSKQMQALKENMALEEGVIEEVFCRNFMCHAKLRIKLGPLINFIIGHNGSGKSAVLTALTMCLGGKATATNRGASLKSLIKEGEDSATLSVKIKNRGDGAYKPDLYGTSITVERHFTRSGTSGFKLKNSQDKIMSTKKSDLDDILDFFAFQLDNPINVLTQDMARQFLSNSTPADKYKFFIRGTQLETLDTDYKILEENLDGIEAKLHSRQQDIEILAQKEQEAERKVKRLERTDAIQEKIRHWSNMHAWAQVEEQEATLKRTEDRVTELKAIVEEKAEAARQKEGAYEGHNQTHEAAQRALEGLKDQLQPVEENCRAAKERFDASRAELTRIQAQERSIKDDVKKHKEVVKKLESEVAEERGLLAGAGGAEHTERLEKLDELTADAKGIKREQMEHGTGFAEVERKRVEAQQTLDAEKPNLQQQKENLRRAEERLSRTQREQPRPFAGFRQNMEQLVRAIERETRWRSKPIGPMGKHVKLLKSEWSSQIEKTCGGALDSFVVTSKEDQDLLSQIMRRTNCSPFVFIGDSTPLDTTGKEPEGVDTIMKVLEIDHSAVRNQLIINQAIDQVVLIRDRNEAYSYMYESDRPRNVKATICFEERDRKKGIRFEWSRSGAQKSSPVDKWTGEQRMKSDREDQIRIQQEDVNQARRDVDAAQQHFRQLTTALETAKQGTVRFKRRQEELKIEVQQAEDAVEEQKTEIDRNQPQDGKLQELERQLAEAKEELEQSNNNYIDMNNEKHQLNEIAKEVKAALEAAKAEDDQGKKNILKAERSLERAENARREALLLKNEAFNAVDGAKRDQQRMEAEAQEVRSQVDQFIGMAEEICRRVPVDSNESAEAIDDRIARLMQDKRRAEREIGGSRDELMLAHQKARQEHADAKAQMKGMNTVAGSLKKTLGNRQQRWAMFRKLITSRARSHFAYLLSERQFRGRLLMSHQDKELDIKIEPDLSKASDAGRAAKTLSGGEKSFSTICLLLSVWEAIGSPIRCLDEFDVFMDSVNRATSMSMMIQAARRAVGKQFILITPQSMQNVDLGDDVKVHKMSDPERGQTTLPF